MEQSEKKTTPKKNNVAVWVIVGILAIIVIRALILSNDNSTDTSEINSYVNSNTTSPLAETTSSYDSNTSSSSSMQESYNAHKNFIWTTCKAALKIDRGVSSGIEGPTYAGEYMDEFIVKGYYGGSTENQFSCVFKKSNNEWGMDITDVR